MASKKITQNFVNSAKCSSGSRKEAFWDTGIKGFHLEVYESGKGTLYYRYKDNRGKYRNHRIGDRNKVTVKAAREAVRIVQGNIAKGIYPDPPEEIKRKQEEARKRDVSFLEIYYEDYCEHMKVRKKSWKNSHKYFENHILPKLGKKKIQELKKHHIEEFVNSLKVEKGFMNSSINRVLGEIKKFLSYVVEHDAYPVETNVAARVRLLKEKEKEYKELTKEEMRRLLASCKRSQNAYLYHIVLLWALTGARRNEVLRAKWKDFYLESQLWVITENKQNRMHARALSDHAVVALKKIPKVEGSEYLFPQRKDITKPTVNIFHALKKAMEEAEIAKNFTPHDFRHQFATIMLKSGENVLYVKELLGHSQLRTTMRYMHVDSATLSRSANSVGDAFGLSAEWSQAS